MIKVIGKWRPELPRLVTRGAYGADRLDAHHSMVQEWRQVIKDCLANHNIRGEMNGGSYPHIRTSQFRPSHLDVINDWHYDNTHSHERPVPEYALQLIVVWATVAPTEIQMADGSAWCAEPYEVLAFTNGDHKHRIPAMTEEQMKQRWFGRAYVDTPESLATQQMLKRYGTLIKEYS